MANPTLDLQTILASLAQYAPPLPAPHPDNVVEQRTHAEQDSSTPSSQSLLPRADDPRPRPQSRNAATASPKPIDPATITTWQDGLRCVTKIAAQNAQFSVAIRKMIADQKKNELRWYSERQALKQTQANRATSAAQAHSILQSLGGKAADLTQEGEYEDSTKAAELAAFDRKIYAAQSEMEAAMTAELKALGVPFFGTDADLIIPDGDDPLKSTAFQSRPRWSPLITEKQLTELKRRIVGHLEDLYKD